MSGKGILNQVLLNGLMEGYILDNIQMIKKTEKDNLFGQIKVNILDIGKTESSKEKELIMA